MELGIRPGATEPSQVRRLAWITAARLAFLVLLLGAVASLYLRGQLERYPFSLRVVFVTIGAGFALAAVYAAALRAGVRPPWIAWTQIVLDQITWTTIVYVSGGASSGATSFYALSCLVGAMLVGGRGAAGAAVVGLSLYGALCVAFHAGWLRAPPDQGAADYAVETADLVYPLLLNTLGVTVVALLAGYLAERLRITGSALERAMARALEAERLAVLGRIAAGFAHEIRNPLGSIRGSIELLRESPALSDEDKRLCDIVQRETRRLNDLVGDMIDLSKPRPPKEQATDVAALAREVVALVENAERGSDVRVRYEGPEGAAVARCDSAQMRQVLWNLLRNAIQASGAGTTVTVRVERGGDDVLLAVDDHGPGVGGTDAQKIFDSFFTTRTHGSGIGLAVVKRVIEDHLPMGASLAIERAQQSGGASFRVTLSRYRAQKRA